ncbi:cysteine-rich repeat secretory protein 38-like [Corylus avellana]|uniref:cysteine-rich repeat secretory protein 38-like n=1 Tax=Corylus avellana TaxID=13451 RepID=UPI00286C075B|nr:cysteine-rich repeat secretory protein 38-like [Corylus avellana]
MVSSTSLLFLLSTIFILTAQAVARPDFLYYFCIHDKGGNSAGNSSYEANFSDLLFSLSAITEIDRGVSHYAYGQNSDQVYAIGFCRGDVNLHACRGFLNDAAFLLTERCPQQKEAIGWYDECMLRYSNRSIRGAEKTSLKFFMWNLYNMSANYDLRTPLERRRGRAAAGGLDLMFAAGNGIPSLYALAQCISDLSEQECNDCLLGAFESIPQCCDGKEGGRVVRPSCNIRFEVYPFYNLTTASSPRTSTNTNNREAHDRSLIFVIINKFVVAIASVVLIISTGIYLSVKGQRKNDESK